MLPAVIQVITIIACQTGSAYITVELQLGGENVKNKTKALCFILITIIVISALPCGISADDTKSGKSVSSVILDGGYKIDFDPGISEYTVFLPSGRPRIPRISVETASGVDIKIYKAFFSDDSLTATAYIVATEGVKQSTYSIRFIRSEKLGFVLQYDDRYKFVPEALTGSISFTSSDPEKAFVDPASGMIRAKSVSDKPITITAESSTGKRETLIIDKIVKAQIDIVMSVGQSNAYGRGGNAALAEKIRPGTAYDIGYDGNTQASNGNTIPRGLGATDGTGAGVEGVRQAFANEWYKTTGEKILFINAADPGIKIAEWQKNGKTYIGAKKEYDRVKELMSESKNFEIYREFFYFNHGSADAGSNFNQNYHAMVVSCFETLFAETDFEFGTFFEYFSSDRAYTTWIRSQHNRIISEMDNIYMGCEMKPYIQADPSLINSDMLHMSQAGHDLCGKLMAAKTAAQALVPGCKYEASAPASVKASPDVAFNFAKGLSPVSGSTELKLEGGIEKIAADGSLEFSDGQTWYKLSEALKLGTSGDWELEFTMKLDGASTQFAVLGSYDNSSQIYINLSDGTTKGFKLRYGPEGAEGTAITLSVRNINDFYSMNTWRFYYKSKLNLLYLYKDGKLQSTEILPGGMTLSQIGKTGSITTENKYAHIKNLKVYYMSDAKAAYTFEFENELNESNGLLKLTPNGSGSFEAESVNLVYSKNNYSFEEIWLKGSADWAFEMRGTITKNTAILANAGGSNTIFANVTDPGFRVRYSSGAYVKLKVAAADFSSFHIWRIEYTSAQKQIKLYRDGEFLSSAAINTDLQFTNSGVSGTTGASNAAIIDYIKLKQKNINRGGGDSIIFGFNNSLTDDSGNYTMKLIKGSTKFLSSDYGYRFGKNDSLNLESGITLPSTNSWRITIKGSFASEGSIIPGILEKTDSGFLFCGNELKCNSTDNTVGEYVFGYDNITSTLSLKKGCKEIASVKKSDGKYQLSSLGGVEMTIYSLSVNVDGDKVANRLAVNISGNAEKGEKLTATVSSDIFDIFRESVRYQWLSDGAVIPGANSDEYTPSVNDIQKSLSCLVTMIGIPESAESLLTETVTKTSEILPEPSDSDLPSDDTDTESESSSPSASESDSGNLPEGSESTSVPPDTESSEPSESETQKPSDDKGCRSSTSLTAPFASCLIILTYMCASIILKKHAKKKVQSTDPDNR